MARVLAPLTIMALLAVAGCGSPVVPQQPPPPGQSAEAPSAAASVAPPVASSTAAPAAPSAVRGAGLTLSLQCAALVRMSGGPSLHAEPPLMLVISNTGGEAATIDEVTGFNWDVPGELVHASDANASFTLRRVGTAFGPQSYSCDDSDPVHPEVVRLAPGEHYRTSVSYLGLAALEPGEYEASMRYDPLDLKSAPCRFRVVP